MATTVSNTLDRAASRRNSHHQPSSTPSRSQSTRVRSAVPSPISPQRTNSEVHRANSRHKPVEEILPHPNYETSNVAQTSRRSSRDDPNRTASTHHRSGHHSRYNSEMSTANGGGPAPVVTPQVEARQSGKGKSRTTIPAQTGNWILGKTIGAGSMGKVKLARRAEGGEQVSCSPIMRDLVFP